ncbi:MAG: ethanolamine utilization protein EutJ, partial [Tissierellia bacterium]|nr:ethanolamine utilization protein EutJ [Tissierellia bacterium]
MKKRLLVALSMVLVFSLLIGCSSNSGNSGGTSTSGSSGSGADTIKVGVNYELTGAVASYGVDLNDGLQMA